MEPSRRREAVEQGDLRGRLHPISLDALLSATSRAVEEGTFSGTYDGVLHTPSGDVPPTGRAISVPYVHVLRYRDGLHVAFNLVFDRLLMLEQLGLVPAPAAVQ